jgi:hypothetical protein
LAQTLTTVQETRWRSHRSSKGSSLFHQPCRFAIYNRCYYTKKLATFENMRQQFFHKYLQDLLGTMFIQNLTSFFWDLFKSDDLESLRRYYTYLDAYWIVTSTNLLNNFSCNLYSRDLSNGPCTLKLLQGQKCFFQMHAIRT